MADTIPFPKPDGPQGPPKPSNVDKLKAFVANFRKNLASKPKEKPLKMPLTERELRSMKPAEQKRVLEQRRIETETIQARARAASEQAVGDKKRVFQELPEAVKQSRKGAGEVKPIQLKPVVTDTSGRTVAGSSVLDRVLGTKYRSELKLPRLGGVQLIPSKPEMASQPSYSKGVLAYDPVTRTTMVGPAEGVERQAANRNSLGVADATREGHKRIGTMFGRAEDWVGKSQRDKNPDIRNMRVLRHNNLLEQVAGRERSQARLAQNVTDVMVREGLVTPERANEVRDNLARSPLVKKTVKGVARELGTKMARGGTMPQVLAPKPSQPSKPPQFASPQSPLTFTQNTTPLGPPPYYPYTPQPAPARIGSRVGPTNVPAGSRGPLAGLNYGPALAYGIPKSIDITPRAGRRGAMVGGNVPLRVPASVPATPTGIPVLNFEKPPTKPTGTSGNVPPVIGKTGERINSGTNQTNPYPARFPTGGMMGATALAVGGMSAGMSNAMAMESYQRGKMDQARRILQAFSDNPKGLEEHPDLLKFVNDAFNARDAAKQALIDSHIEDSQGKDPMADPRTFSQPIFLRDLE